jgi:glutamate-ammonia-ligase adenylyltransferase
VGAFGVALTTELETVQTHYAQLFERAAPLGSASGSLVFTGVEDDPGTIETLQKMGFREPGHAAAAIRGWHHGRIRATRSDRARELLTKLMPALLDALATSADPDAAFVQFDRFVSRLPAGVQLFSLLLANPDLLKLIATIAGSAPRLADTLARSPQVLDALLDPGFLGELPSREHLDRTFATLLSEARGYESVLNLARRFAREQIFRVGVQIVQGAVKAEAAGIAFAAIAECVIVKLLEKVEAELGAAAGRIEGGSFAVIAMGKLGGHEMTAASDLDLIFVYDAPADVEFSNGAKPLAVATYYARLAQRLIAALTTQTAEGGLYDVDMRLRPTGNQGPVAVSLESFSRYYRTREAWTWERLALTRARVISAAGILRTRVEETILSGFSRKPDEAVLKEDARAMREKLAMQYPAKSVWDLKFTAGGLVDIEFVAQYLQLKHAFENPAVLDPNVIDSLQRLKQAGCLEDDRAGELIAACALEHALTQVLRIAVDGVLDAPHATSGLKSLLCRAGGADDFETLEKKLAQAQAEARAAFDHFLTA